MLKFPIIVRWFALISLATGAVSAHVAITAPAPETVFAPGSAIPVSAHCPGGVEFFADGVSIGTSPCEAIFLWNGAPAGVHALTATAERMESEPVIVFVADRAERPVMTSFRGRVIAIAEDRFDSHLSRTHFAVLSNGDYLPIIGAGAHVRALAQAAGEVTLEGWKSSGRFCPREEPPERPESVAAPIAATGVRKVAVVLINYLNQTMQPFTAAQATALMTTVNQFYKEASYGQFSIQSDVFGYLNLPINETCTDLGDVSSPGGSFAMITNAGLQAAKSAGIDLTPYGTVLFLGPTATQCYGGVATIGVGGVSGVAPGTPGLIMVRENGYNPLFAGILAHELGHNLGLYHSHSFACTNTIYDPAMNCNIVEYGDVFDVMGVAAIEGKSIHPNASYKELLGWLRPQTVTSTGTFQIGAFEATGYNALKILPPAGNDKFYVEFREPKGFDAVLDNPEIFQGALIHLGAVAPPNENNGNSAFVLNMHPGSVSNGYPLMPALLPGETYTDYQNRFSITTLDAGQSGLTVQVLMPNLTAPAALFQSPSDGSTVGGTAQVTVGALDRMGISKVELYRDGGLLSALTAMQYSFNWDTSKESIGPHQLTAIVYNHAGTTYSTSIHVAVHRLPAISLAVPSVAGVGRPVALSAQLTLETGATATVQFAANGVLIGTGSPSTGGVYTFNWTPNAAGIFAITATVTDSNGLSATTAAMNMNVASAAITNVQTAFGETDIAQNTWIQINGFGLAPPSVPSGGLTWSGAPDIAVGRMPTSLAGVAVTVNGKAAFPFFISPQQLNVLTPLDSTIGAAQIVVTNTSAGNQVTAMASLRAVVPSLPLLDGNYVAATHLDGSDVGPASLFPGLTSPARPGEQIVVYGFGFGLPSTPLVDGSATQSGMLPSLPEIKIGAIDAVVSFAGVVSPGLYQFNVTIPEIAQDGDNAIVISYQGASTPAGNLIAIQR
jgi:uncharacterized protein (TIGR03437 family)